MSAASHEEIWRRYDAMEVRLTAPLSERMLDLAGVGPGKRVLDLATGRGEPAIRAAHRVGASGAVVGVDIDANMLKIARERADREGIGNLELQHGSASALVTSRDNARFDATLVRWGLMYMDAPVDALLAARRVMVPDGVLVAAVFCEPERVAYVSFPRRVLARFAAVPPIDCESPGTFRYARRERLHVDLEAAGYRVAHAEELDLPLMEGETPAEVVAWTRAFGMNRLLNGLPIDVQQQWESAMLAECESLREDGLLRLRGTTRIVVARAVH